MNANQTTAWTTAHAALDTLDAACLTPGTTRAQLNAATFGAQRAVARYAQAAGVSTLTAALQLRSERD